MIKMETHTELWMRSIPMHCMRGIYFLWKGESIIYIGQSVNARARILAHAYMGYDSYSIVEYPTEDLNDLEADYIIREKPINNKGLPSNTLWKSCQMIKREYSLESITIVKKLASKYAVKTELFAHEIYYWVPAMLSALETEGKI